MRNLFDKDNGKIGCIILDNVKFFSNPVLLSLIIVLYQLKECLMMMLI